MKYCLIDLIIYTMIPNLFFEEKICTYRGETYSVRNDGSIMRHQRKDKRIRPLDNKWTFGNKSNTNGYMYINTEAVHRIVATAFHGEHIQEFNIVDHIDTNRCNNRPENLKWTTRLGNILENEITRARIENLCGSVEAFLKNPSVLKGHEHVDKNFAWMRTVSSEEAKYCLELELKWAKNPTKSNGGTKGEWLFSSAHSAPVVVHTPEVIWSESLTPNVRQFDWTTPTEFPCCPQHPGVNPLNEYLINLKKGAVFCTNPIYKKTVLEAALIDDKLFVLSYGKKENVKPWGLTKIEYKDGYFLHCNEGTFFKEDGGYKYYTLAQGKEWTGGDVFDDYC